MPRLKGGTKPIVERLDALATVDIPEPFASYYSTILGAAAEMSKEAAALGLAKTFTPDGKLKGDLGEVIGFAAYQLKLHPKLRGGEDGICEKTELSVEVKCRATPSDIWVKPRHDKRLPAILLLIWLNERTMKWGEVYNGSAEILLNPEFASFDSKNQRYTTSVAKLLRASERTPKDAHGHTLNALRR